MIHWTKCPIRGMNYFFGDYERKTPLTRRERRKNERGGKKASEIKKSWFR